WLWVLCPRTAIGVGDLGCLYRLQQRARGKKSKGAAKELARHRRDLVNLFLRYVVDEKYRKDPTSGATIMEIINLLDTAVWHGIEASVPQVRRDIYAVLKRGPLD